MAVLTSRLGRRAFLRGVGACLPLPFLGSLAQAGPPTPPRRLLYYYVPNGFRMDRWVPEGTGTGFAFTPLQAALERHRDAILIPTGIDNAPGNRRPEDAGAGAHFQQTASLLTCRHIAREPFAAGVSIDQVAAQALGYVTPFRSLALGMAASSSGSCGGASWPCSYLGSISWADATTPLAKVNDATGLFRTVFASSALGVTETEFERRRDQRLRILDVVGEDAKALQSRLSSADRLTLDRYLTAVDETEQQVLAQTYGLSCDPGEAPAPGGGYLARLEAMLDVMVLALECDVTRVMTFMTHNGGASHSSPYDWVSYAGAPVTDTFHTLSHHGGDPEKLGKIEAINAWEIEVFAGLLDRLAAVPQDDGGTLLDHTVAFFGSEVSDGHTHSADNLPIVVAGRGGGHLQTGRHLPLAGRSLGDLLGNARILDPQGAQNRIRGAGRHGAGFDVGQC
ncbi:MAG: DUF1552 domain-containing protein [Myxococcota bacterium]